MRGASGSQWLVTGVLLWGIATIYTLRRFYILMRRTTISLTLIPKGDVKYRSFHFRVPSAAGDLHFS